MASGYREWWKKFISQDRRSIVRLVMVGGAGVLLLAFGSFGIARPSPPVHTKSTLPQNALQRQEEEIGSQVTQILDKIPGVKSASVAVTLARSIQSQYVDSSGSGSGNQPVLVTTNTGQTVVPLDQIGPAVAGIVVVSPSAVHPMIRQELSQAVETLLQIQAYQVLILPN